MMSFRDDVMQPPIEEVEAYYRGQQRVCAFMFESGGTMALYCTRPWRHRGEHASSAVFDTVRYGSSDKLDAGYIRVVTAYEVGSYSVTSVISVTNEPKED